MRTNRWTCVPIITCALAGLASAGEPSVVLETRFREALRGESWHAALSAYAALPARDRTPRLTYLAAEAHVRLREYRASADLLEGLLERRDDNLEALYLLARVRARQGKMELAKGLLLQAASAGQLVTRDISYGEGKELFGKLQRDPRFVLQLMRSSQAASLDGRGLRDPFRRPAKDWKRPPEKRLRGGTPQEAATRLEREISALLEEMAGHAEREELEPLLTKLSELRGLLVEFEELGLAAAKAKLKEFKRRHRAMDDLAASIQLSVDVAEGNIHLRAMAKQLSAGAYAETIATCEKLDVLCERMRKSPRAMFQRNAQALWERGRRMREAAKIQLEIQALDLKLTGIVVPPDAPGKAIVNDRIHTEGDHVYDPASREERDDLVVVAVAKGRVSFRYRGVTFVRALERGLPPARPN